MSNAAPDRFLAYIDGEYFKPTMAMLDIAGTGNIEVLVDDQHSTLLVSNAQGCLLRINGIRGHLQFRDLYGSKAWRPSREREESRVDYVSADELRKELQRLRNAEAASDPVRFGGDAVAPQRQSWQKYWPYRAVKGW